jgi:hypothetical protein
LNSLENPALCGHEASVRVRATGPRWSEMDHA